MVQPSNFWCLALGPIYEHPYCMDSDIYVSLSSDKCTNCKSLSIKSSAKWVSGDVVVHSGPQGANADWLSCEWL